MLRNCRSYLLLVVVGLVWPIAQTGADPVLVFSPDLSFQFVCKDIGRSDLEQEIERFLREVGFKVLNQGRIQREHDVFLLATNIVALDGQRRVIDVISVPRAKGKYELRLQSPPPTKRAPPLEDALLKFVARTLGCEAREIIRGENGPDARAYYESRLRAVENLFHEAEELRDGRRL